MLSAPGAPHRSKSCGKERRRYTAAGSNLHSTACCPRRLRCHSPAQSVSRLRMRCHAPQNVSAPATPPTRLPNSTASSLPGCTPPTTSSRAPNPVSSATATATPPRARLPPPHPRSSRTIARASRQRLQSGMPVHRRSALRLNGLRARGRSSIECFVRLRARGIGL